MDFHREAKEQVKPAAAAITPMQRHTKIPTKTRELPGTDTVPTQGTAGRTEISLSWLCAGLHRGRGEMPLQWALARSPAAAGVRAQGQGEVPPAASLASFI